ncbi:isochorismatase family protein [Nocardia sp. NPDC051052]|uniref:isochorismatase family protein n=1 Tax=Nocardia sp. NPDC051052 TaxID=3364322 RepID=UPI0037AFC7A3
MRTKTEAPAAAGIPAIGEYPMPTVADLPPNVARWTVEPDRAVLLIHDMQRYFLRPFASAVRAGLVGNISTLRDLSNERGIPVAYTTQPGSMTDAQRGLLKDFWGPGMSVDPIEREVIDALSPAADDWVFTKWRYSAFFRSELLGRMRAQGRDQLVLCGVYAHIGVLMSAVDAFTNDIQPFLIADAIADFSADYHRLAIEFAAERCAVVTTTADVFA